MWILVVAVMNNYDPNALQPEMLITGTGHCGTLYTAKLLRSVYVNAGHESYYSFPWMPSVPVGVDVSWIGALYLDSYKGKVLHQTRNPVKVLNSYYNFFKGNHTYSWSFIQAIMPQYTGDLLQDLSAHLCDLYHRIERASLYTYKVEDIDKEIVEKILSMLGMEAEERRIEIAVGDTNTATNRHVTKQTITYNDCPDDIKEWHEVLGYAN